MAVGKRIENIAKEKKISLRKIALNAGISYNTLYAIVKRDSNRIDLETLEKIAGALGVKVTDLKYDSPATSFSEMHKRLTENGVENLGTVEFAGEDKKKIELITANFAVSDDKGKQDIVEYSQMVADRTLKQRKQNGDPGKE